MLSILYYVLTALFFLGFLFMLMNKNRLGNIALFAGALTCGVGIVLLVVTEHRPPLLGAFESTIYIFFILCLLELISFRSVYIMAFKPKTGIFTCGVMVIILALQITTPKQFNHDFFMYENLWVNLFFNLRLVAAAFFIRAAILFNLAAWACPDKHLMDASTAGFHFRTPGFYSVSGNGCFEKFHHNGVTPPNSKALQKNTLYMARNFLLLGVAVYLVSEWSGSFWCLNWLGDTWRWSGGFFKASLIFLLVMAVFHLPPSMAKLIKIRAVIGSGPAMVITWMIFYH